MGMAFRHRALLTAGVYDPAEKRRCDQPHQACRSRPYTLVVVGTASRVPDAIRLALRTRPQVAVVDVSMPDGGGWAAARGLREVCPGIRLVAFTSFDNALVIRTIAAAGINAYVTKGSAIEVLLAAIHGEDVMPAPPQRMSLIRRTAGVTTD